MADDSEIQAAKSATPTNGNTLSSPSNSDSTWNYVWDEKLCKTTLQLYKTTVYTPPISSVEVEDSPDSEDPYVCPVAGCKKSFSKECKQGFRIHLKQHLPENEKPFKCDYPSCTRAFVVFHKLKVHKRTHTGEKPYECEQCGKKFSRLDSLTHHLGTHIKGTNKALSLEDDSDDAIDSEMDDSSSVSLVSTDLEQHLEEEMDTDTETDGPEMDEIKVEPKKITEPHLPDFNSSDLHVPIKQTKIDEAGVNDELKPHLDFKSIDTPSGLLIPPPIQLMPVKQEILTEINEYDDAIKLEIAMKQEINTGTANEYVHGFDKNEQYEMKEMKHVPAMIGQPYFPDVYSSDAPTSMSAAIQRLAFPMPIANTHRFDKNDQYEMKPIKDETQINAEPYFPDLYSSYEPSSMSSAILRLPLPISNAESNIQSENKPTTNIQPEYMHTKNIESKSKSDKPYKCSVEGCVRAFKVPYGLKRHSWVHTKVKTFECDQCKKLFLRKDHLAKHMKTHTRPPIIKPKSSR